MSSPDKPTRRQSLFERTTSDLLVLMIAATICGAVVFGGATVVVTEIIRPQTDTTPASAAIGDIINTLVGLLAGFLAGKTTQTKPPG